MPPRRFVRACPFLLAGLLPLASGAEPVSTAPAAAPSWLQDSSLTVRESYDDNLMRVSGVGLPREGSWVSSVGFNLGLDLMPLLGPGGALKTFTLHYRPEASTYEADHYEDNIAHRIESALAGKSGAVSFNLEDSLLVVDGGHRAATYALNESAGADANQDDRFRNNYAHPAARDRRSQMQERATARVQWDAGSFFVRAVGALTYYDFHTDLLNNGVLPNRGYQDYLNCYDLNGGVDLGWRIRPDLALTLGAREGFQSQPRLDPAISSDQHFSSSHYGQVLVGIDGKLSSGLAVRVAAGPDFRNYNAAAPVDHDHTARWFGEASATWTISPAQSVKLAFHQWLWVSLNGQIPFEDMSSSLSYRWHPAGPWTLETGIKVLRANFTIGNDLAGSSPSRRDDILYGCTALVARQITRRLSVTLAYTLNTGRNNLSDLPASLAPAYRDFSQNLTALSVQCAF